MVTKQMLSEQVLEDLRDYAENPQGFVLMTGLNGRGKSYVARKVYERRTPYKLPERDYDLAWFINQAQMTITFAEYNEKYGSSMILLKRGCETKFLVIDDLGTRDPSPAFMDFFYAIVDYRWELRSTLGTIITTNLGSSEIRKKFSDAVFSRIASGRNYVVIGDDRRFTDLGF